MPVSSSSVMNMMPLALPGRYRTSTMRQAHNYTAGARRFAPTAGPELISEQASFVGTPNYSKISTHMGVSIERRQITL